MNTYLIVSAIVLIMLSLIWSKEKILNWLIKVFLFLLGLCGLFFWLIQIGYILNINT